MASLPGRYFSARDLRLHDSFNAELLGDIVQTTCDFFKLSLPDTKTNVYGESDSSTGKVFYPGIEMTVWVKRDDTTTEDADFGPDRFQTVDFMFREATLRLVNIYPESGDIISFNERYYEIGNVVQEQFRGGIPEKSLSIICHASYTRLSKLNIIKRQI
jgi:hypothetical protein